MLSKRTTLTVVSAAVLMLTPTTLAAAAGPSSGSTPASAPAASPASEGSGPGVRATTTDYTLDAKIHRTLGSRTAGTYLDADTGELVVTVTSEEAATQVRSAGARAEIVHRSSADLRKAMTELREKAGAGGTSWGIDPRRNQVVAEADSTVTATELARLKAVAKAQHGAVQVKRVPGAFHEEVLGGDAIYGGGVRCSAAFNVTQGTTRFFVTAGHCAESATDWSATNGGPAIGKQEGHTYPVDDHSLVRYTDGSDPAGDVNLWNGSSQDITRAADAVVGQSLQKSGSTTHLTSGTVTATDVTVDYGSGNVVDGMVRTTACSAGGDSGGAHFAGDTALGIHSGSSGCTGTDGSAIHQPVTKALSAYNVNVY